MNTIGIEHLIHSVIDDIAAPGVTCYVIDNGMFSGLNIRLTKITYGRGLPATKMIQFPIQGYKDDPNSQWSGIPLYLANHIYHSDPDFLSADAQATIRNNWP